MNHVNHDKYHEQVLVNLANIHSRIEEACIRCGRHQEEVRLMLVTKTVPVQTIRMVLEQGEQLIGENLIEELEHKIDTAKGRLKELGEASEETWEHLKDKVEHAWDTLSHSVQDATAKLKSKFKD